MSWVTLLGYAASATVLATFCMNTMIPLRVIALVSNVLFMAYGYADQLYPVLLLHAILLPVNALRLAQFYRLVREMREAPRKDLSVQTLLPYMTRRKFSVGQALVRKGERADRLYYLVDGEIEVVEFSKVLHPGVMVGQMVEKFDASGALIHEPTRQLLTAFLGEFHGWVTRHAPANHTRH